jgi:hypothetical protein
MSDASKTQTQTQDLKTVLSAIEPRNTLMNTSISASIIQMINQKFTGVNLNDHRLDPNLIIFICDCIEASFQNSKNKKVDKKQEVLKILKQVVTLSEVDVKSIDCLIEFFHSSGQIRAIEQEVVDEVVPFFKRLFFGSKKN